MKSIQLAVRPVRRRVLPVQATHVLALRLRHHLDEDTRLKGELLENTGKIKLAIEAAGLKDGTERLTPGSALALTLVATTPNERMLVYVEKRGLGVRKHMYTLQDRGYLRPVPEYNKELGRSTVVWQLTDAGHDALRKIEEQLPRSRRRNH